jgi:hypothetical protein
LLQKCPHAFAETALTVVVIAAFVGPVCPTCPRPAESISIRQPWFEPDADMLIMLPSTPIAAGLAQATKVIGMDATTVATRAKSVLPLRVRLVMLLRP